MTYNSHYKNLDYFTLCIVNTRSIQFTVKNKIRSRKLTLQLFCLLTDQVQQWAAPCLSSLLELKGFLISFWLSNFHTLHSYMSKSTLEIFGIFDSWCQVYIKELGKFCQDNTQTYYAHWPHSCINERLLACAHFT